MSANPDTATLVRGIVFENVKRIVGAQLAGLGWSVLLHPTLGVAPAGATTDLAVAPVCGSPQNEMASACAALDILPPHRDSAAEMDRLKRLRQHPHLRDLVIINTSSLRVEHWFRSERSPWLFELVTSPTADLHLHSLGITIGLKHIYLRVHFPSSASRPSA